eukprot:358494-Chlamydomonas_euryale.AAC.2
MGLVQRLALGCDCAERKSLQGWRLVMCGTKKRHMLDKEHHVWKKEVPAGVGGLSRVEKGMSEVGRGEKL